MNAMAEKWPLGFLSGNCLLVRDVNKRMADYIIARPTILPLSLTKDIFWLTFVESQERSVKV